jgi:trehalose 6-phosphate synthase
MVHRHPGTEAGGYDLIVSSARGPVTYSLDERGSLAARQSAGGLATALRPVLGPASTWVCLAQSPGDMAKFQQTGGQPFIEEVLGRHLGIRLVQAPDFGEFTEALAQIQLLQSNALKRFDRGGVPEAFERYEQASAIRARAILDEVTPHSRVMLNDHHDYLLPEQLRLDAPDLPIWLYVHMSMSPPSTWRVLPTRMRERLFRSLLQCDLIGFHSSMWASQFFDICGELRDVAVDREKSLVSAGPRNTGVRVYSLPADKDGWLRRQHSDAVRRWIVKLERPGMIRIVAIDRSDRTKNVIRGYEALELTLEQHPELIGRVVLMSHVVPSRQNLAVQVGSETRYPYREYLDEIRIEAARINERFGQHVVELYTEDDRDLACALMSIYDVLMVIPLFEGMNSIAKEGPLLNDRGVVLLSPTIGAASLLTPALRVDQFDYQDIARVLHRAVTMSPQARRTIGLALHRLVVREDPRTWFEAQIRDLDGLIQGRTESRPFGEWD